METCNIFFYYLTTCLFIDPSYSVNCTCMKLPRTACNLHNHLEM